MDQALEALPQITYMPRASKIRILLLYIVYPMAIASYFRKALEHREDIDLKVAGPYTGAFIPWMGGMELSKKYDVAPDIPLPFLPTIGEVNYDLVKAMLGEWIPDLIINIDAGLHWKYKPTDGYCVTVATDPHCLDYDYQRTISDKFFNMQAVYSKRGDIYLPYAYSQYDHYPEDLLSAGKPNQTKIEKDTDAVLIGMPYEQRVQWVNELRNRGVSVIFENGPVFDEARTLYNRGRIGLNWSSLDDLNARCFEIPAMKLAPVMNLVTDVGKFFEQGTHYQGFTSLREAVDTVLYLRDHPDKCNQMAQSAYENVQGQHYDARVETILRECGFI